MIPASAIVLASAGASWQAGGFSWWQTIGAMLAVFALLILVLRWLGRWQGGAGNGPASLLAVMPLGHRREVQVLRLNNEVHYIYRYEGALLLLGKETYADYQAAHPVTGRHRPTTMPTLVAKWLGRTTHQETQPPQATAASIAAEEVTSR
jgi:hypothetical protein